MSLSFSLQSIVSEFFRPDFTGKVRPNQKEIPFSFYTSTPRIANLFPLDLFNVLPKIQTMRQNHIAMSKMEVDVSNVEQMGEVL